MDILDDMGVSKLSAKVIFKSASNSACKKQLHQYHAGYYIILTS